VVLRPIIIAMFGIWL